MLYGNWLVAQLGKVTTTLRHIAELNMAFDLVNAAHGIARAKLTCQ
jgi:hypothetical protein